MRAYRPLMMGQGGLRRSGAVIRRSRSFGTCVSVLLRGDARADQVKLGHLRPPLRTNLNGAEELADTRPVPQARPCPTTTATPSHPMPAIDPDQTATIAVRTAGATSASSPSESRDRDYCFRRSRTGSGSLVSTTNRRAAALVVRDCACCGRPDAALQGPDRSRTRAPSRSPAPSLRCLRKSRSAVSRCRLRLRCRRSFSG